MLSVLSPKMLGPDLILEEVCVVYIWYTGRYSVTSDDKHAWHCVGNRSTDSTHYSPDVGESGEKCSFTCSVSLDESSKVLPHTGQPLVLPSSERRGDRFAGLSTSACCALTCVSSSEALAHRSSQIGHSGAPPACETTLLSVSTAACDASTCAVTAAADRPVHGQTGQSKRGAAGGGLPLTGTLDSLMTGAHVGAAPPGRGAGAPSVPAVSACRIITFGRPMTGGDGGPLSVK